MKKGKPYMKTSVVQPHKSSFGMDANTFSMIVLIATGIAMWIPLIVYVAWAVPLVLFFMEKESKFVKFQACTAIIIGIASAAFEVVFRLIIWVLTPRSYAAMISFALRGGWGLYSLFTWLLAIIGIALTALVVYLIVMAHSYKQVELPIIGAIAKKASDKLDTVNVNTQSSNTQTTNAAGAAVPASVDKPVFCGECSARNESGTKFCGSCGKSLA
jgi:uncharacterized membrane protein